MDSILVGIMEAARVRIIAAQSQLRRRQPSRRRRAALAGKEKPMPGSNLEPPKEAAAVFRMAFGFISSQVLYVAAELGIADHLAHGPLTAEDLASKTGVHAGALARLLRALVAFGILKCEGEDRFLLTSTGEFLRNDISGS